MQELACPLKFSSVFAREQQPKKEGQSRCCSHVVQHLWRPTGKRDVEEGDWVSFKRWWWGSGGGDGGRQGAGIVLVENLKLPSSDSFTADSH